MVKCFLKRNSMRQGMRLWLLMRICLCFDHCVGFGEKDVYAGSGDAL